MALGLESVYGDNEVGSDGLTKKQRKYKEDSIAYDRMMDEIILKQVASVSFSDFYDHDDFGGSVVEEIPASRNGEGRVENRINHNVPQTRPASSASTIRSRQAAAALSGAKPSSIRARPASAQLLKPKTSALFPSEHTRAPSNPSTMRHTAAVASSRTTVGYSRGRSMASALHGKVSVAKKQTTSTEALSPEAYMRLYGPPPFGSEMWIRCKAAGCFDEESNREAANEEDLPTFGEDEEAENFQLTL